MTGVEPAWPSSQNWWVTVTLHPEDKIIEFLNSGQNCGQIAFLRRFDKILDPEEPSVYKGLRAS